MTFELHGNILLAIIPLLALIYIIARTKVSRLSTTSWHSLPGYYAWHAIICATLPAIIIGTFFSILHLFDLYHASASLYVPFVTVMVLVGAVYGLNSIAPSLKARDSVERFIRWLLVTAAMISILTTVGIVLSVIFEATHFFKMVSFWDFVTGTSWTPDDATPGNTKGMFGSVPIFAGTFMVTLIAMLVAVPIGLLSAIYTAEYSSNRVRNIAKPALEVLAGIPTVVYGFFAAVTISPMVVHFAESMGIAADYTNILTPGLVMGIMIIPFISSLSDDVIRSIPQNMRDGSLALGTTVSETIRHILLPAALPGIVAAFLLGVSRALGETMIVVMAAGLRPNLTWNPLEGMTTVTVRIVDALTGDQSFDSPETLSAFGLGLVLLIITLMLNIVSIYVVRRFRQQYE
ncbi:MAG: phosphate ABC transporter permease subunit PstC [Zetaproteobacteria bacterium]|nr:phosphate ABC transporter permease subunit PstC [Zetaproteobacteria bacterium]